jgi:CubicO group peptidase (beta-lactamase class C family)
VNLTVLGALSASLVSFHQEPVHPDLQQRIRAEVRAALDGTGASQLQVLVMFADEHFAQLVLPASDGEQARRVPLGAISHMLFAVAAMRLQDEEKLDLEARAGTWLPELGDSVGAVTVHELLTHTSGLFDWEELAPDAESRSADLSAALAAVAKQGTRAPHGTCFWPSSSDTLVLGALLQRVLGGSVLDHLQRTVGPRVDAEFLSACDGAATQSGLLRRLGEDERCADVQGLARFMRTFAQRELVSERSWRAMTEGDQLPEGVRTRFGHGLDLAALDGHERFAFGGSSAGTHLQVAHYPAFELTIVVAVTRGDLDAEALERSLARLVYATPDPRILDLPLSEDESLCFTGDYLIGCDRTEVRFTDGRLVLHFAEGEAVVLLRQSRDGFVAPGARELAVRFEGEGARASSFVLEERGWQSRAIRID